MASEQTVECLNKLIERGEELGQCLTLLREMTELEEKNAARSERAAERDAKMKERDCELRLRELQLKEKELEMTKHVSPSSVSPGLNLKVKLPKLVEGQDIEVFLTSFERLALVHSWPKSQWPVHLIPQLSGKALEAYSRMSLAESKDYDCIKKAILNRYGLNAWEYREKFRNCKQNDYESFKEFSVRMKSYFDHWKDTESVDGDFENLVDMVIKDQLMHNAEQDLQVWLKEHQPKTVSEMVGLAEAYQLAHKTSERKSFQRKFNQGNFTRLNQSDNKDHSQTKRKCYVCDSSEHLIATCPYKLKRDKPDAFQKEANGLLLSPTKRGAVVEIPIVSNDTEGQIQLSNGLRICSGSVNGKPVKVLRDTGCTSIFVSEQFFKSESLTGVKKEVVLADGSSKSCFEIQIDIQTPFISGVVNALVMDNPFADLIIGNLGYVHPDHGNKESLQVVTRNMRKKELQDEIVRAEADERWKSDDYRESDVYESSALEGNVSRKIENADDLKIEQEKDVSLQKVIELAKGPKIVSRNAYFYENGGILYRAFIKGDGSEVSQVIVPKVFRTEIMRIAHDIPLGGHLGNRKTRNRILRNFFWPGIFRDVANHCRSCPQCQRSVAKGRVKRTHLVSVPLITEPFQRVSIDIVGPLNRTKRGHKYILTMVDYGTKFPEAIPLKCIDSESVAEALVSIFSRVGIPKEILSDQGSNFTSAVMKQVCQMLNIKKILSTPYHPEANGLVERFNGTLKRMLTCFVQDEKMEWDILLPYLLFAYREVPQDSTGFSPFELLYGRHVRGPLSIIRETWEEPKGEVKAESVVSYLMKMREKLGEIRYISEVNEIRSKKKQKFYYDKKARTRDLKPGQKVSVLLPSVANKLLAQWKGPFLVVKKVSPVDYVVQTGKSSRTLKTFHINMLKEWFERAENGDSEVEVGKLSEEAVNCNASINLTEMVDDEEVVSMVNPLLVPSEGVDHVKINPELTDEQMYQLKTVLNKYADVLSDVPGRTNLIEHDLKLDSNIPVRKKAYCLPYALRDKVEKEIYDMVEAGIAEKSTSSYASPIVVVPKKDSSIRLCVDYRQLNQVTIFDPQPMPKLEDIINKLLRAKYMSKLDLTKGFWQIPLAEEAKEKSAFITPFGHFQFLVLPFGMINSSASFVRLMKMVLANMEKFADAFIDDVMIFSEEWEDHLLHVTEVLKALQKASLTAKPSKCRFGYQQLEFLAHIVGNGEVHPTPDKIEAIQKVSPPKTKKQVRSFIGMIGFYRKFIPHFADLSAILTDLTSKQYPNKVKWSEKHQEAFDALKKALVSYPILQNPDFSQNFVLQTDACERGYGSVLLQERGECRHPIIFISKKLLPRERHYGTVEKECLAIVKSCQSLREYLIGKVFTIETDHFPLQWLNRVKDKNMRLLRWSLILQEFRFVVQHIPGKTNVLADMLSRIHSEQIC